jgi:hypothetical protein
VVVPVVVDLLDDRWILLGDPDKVLELERPTLVAPMFDTDPELER